MGVAAVGILVNTFTALMFARGGKDDINIRGAFLHMAADAAVSAGVVVAGLVISRTGWLWLDPAASLAIVAIIAVGTWDLLKQAVALAIDSVPDGIDRHAVEAYLLALPGVTQVHDLHIWPLSTTETALTAHLVRSEDRVDDAFTAEVCGGLRRRFRISHSTLQFETGAEPCGLEHSHAL
jgi:cobalt-zinc-cadmium efflux system protein